MPPDDVEFVVDGVPCAAWHFGATGDELASDAGRPCVVAAHGLGATRDSGLAGFGERFAEQGIDAVVFDYRHFGASGGEPRQLVSARRQLADFRAAVGVARRLPGVDPGRVVLWGVSFSTGHVVRLALADRAIAAIIALTPAWDGLAQLRNALERDGPAQVARLTALAMRDMLDAARGRPPVTVPLAGRPGDLAVLTAPGVLDSLQAVGGPTWRNEIAARILAEVPLRRPPRRIASLGRPMLVQIADGDRSAPPGAAMRVAVRARAEVRRYPCDHADVLEGQDWHDAVLEDQLAFLRRHLDRSLRPAGTLARVR